MAKKSTEEAAQARALQLKNPQTHGSNPIARVGQMDLALLGDAMGSDEALRAAAMSPRPAIIAGLVIIALFFAGVVLWTVCVPLRSAINAPAEVVFKSKRQSVQHLEGGIVKSILVKDGDMVQAGQPLIKLESSQVQPLVQMLEDQGVAEAAFAARVDAESRGLPSIHFPRSLTDRAKEPAVAKVMESEQRLFQTRRASFQNQVQMLRLQIAEIKESSKGTRERLASKQQEMESIREQLQANQTLQKQGYVTNTVVLDLQRALAAYAGEKEALVASIASDRQRIAEVEQRILALKAEQIQGSINEMKQSSMRRIDQQERERPLRDTLERLVIRAPVAGRVVGLRVTTVGGIIQPREQIMEIAPVNDHLILEARIRLEDVSDAGVGQEADVHISGLDSRTTPPLKGKISYLSDDRVMPQQPGQTPYYAATVELDQPSLKYLESVRVKPGMSATVAVATKPKTPLEYIMEPVQEHLRKALSTK